MAGLLLMIIWPVVRDGSDLFVIDKLDENDPCDDFIELRTGNWATPWKGTASLESAAQLPCLAFPTPEA